MSPFDAAWLQVDSHETPMQVGSLQIFSPPPGAPDDFLLGLVGRLRASRAFVAPWSYRLQSPALARVFPMWRIDDGLDLDYHVRHSALPRPGGERELGMLVSRLHSHPLDLSRPPWEFHVIEGLGEGRFAMYCKMHHSLIDGVGAMRMLMRIMSPDPGVTGMPAPWTVGPRRGARSAEPTPEATLADALRAQARSLPETLRALGELLSGGRDAGDALVAPFSGPRSILNGRVTGQRRFATQRYDLERLRALGRAHGCTLNDVVLYLTGSALRRFLAEAGELPDEPLTAGIPVNVRPADDDGVGTALSFMMATLATDVPDPLARLRAITASTRRAKEHLASLPRTALAQYTLLAMAPYIAQLLSGLGGRTRPAFNVTISNVPGPDQPLYFDGARQEAVYPLSLIAHGLALNVTCLSYDGSLSFGFTGCRDSVPHMQNLAVYAGEALGELESSRP